MKRACIVVGVIVMLAAAMPVSAAPAKRTTAPVMTHPSQGPVVPVEGAYAMLVSNDAGITVTFQTHQLDLGHAHTLWVVMINRPDLCLESPCAPSDVLGRTDIVEANIVYGSGRVVRHHTTQFAAHVPVGEVVGGWFDNPLTNPRGAEIHLVINDHGPMIHGLTLEMTRTYRAGCTDESLPPAFPDTAFADGTPGPNTCRLMQFSILDQR